MSWAPEDQPLSELAIVLKDSLNAQNKVAQRNAEGMLKQAKTSPGITNYLTFLSTHPTPISGMSLQDYHAARSAAAIMLKNSIKSSYKTLPEENKTYVRSTILTGLQDQNAQIRNYCGTVITEIVRQGGIMGWPQVLSELIALIEHVEKSVSPEAQDGAMGALAKICEDNKKSLNKSYNGTRPIDLLVPKLLDFTLNPSPKVRAKALGTLNNFIDQPLPEAVRSNAEKMLQQLVQLANDQHDDVRRFVCRAFTALARVLPEIIAPHLNEIIDYVLVQQRADPSSEIALDAADFFFENCEKDELRAGFSQRLDKIVPVLLEGMIYSEDDQARLETEAEEDADREDKEQDLKPQFATSKSAGGAAGTHSIPEVVNGTSKASVNGYAYDEDDDLSEGEIDEDDDYGDDPEDQWNLRKCSAASLDSFANHYHQSVFAVTLPYLTVNLNHQNWPNREAAVLALGAISVGCLEDVQPHLPDLTRFLLSLLNDSQPVVRQITCWALGRYSAWSAHLDPSGKQQFFEPVMDGLLQRMLDRNKRVQEAAASAFANLEEQAAEELKPYCIVIAQQFAKCFEKYKDRNMYILYDCVQTLAEHVGADMARPELVDLLMPALISRWSKVSDQSREMFPLLECLAYISTALGPAFAPFAKPFFARCIKIIESNLEEGAVAAEDAVFETPDKDFLVTSLDLLSSIIQALDEQNVVELVATSQPNMFAMLAYCMRDTNNDVRQSAYALLGDCAIYAFSQLQPYLADIVRILIPQLDLTEPGDDPDTVFRVINNACWSIGEIAMRHQAGMAPYVDDLLQKLATILFSNEVPESLNENAAIALGRLGVGSHERLSNHLAAFAPRFLNVMRNVAWTDEKLHAFQGFTSVVLDNPQALEQCLILFFAELASAPPALVHGATQHGPGPFEDFKKVLLAYKAMIPDFDSFLQHLQAPQYQALRETYGV